MEIAIYCLSNIIMEISDYCSRYSMPWRTLHRNLIIPNFYFICSFASTCVFLYRIQMVTKISYFYENRCLNIWLINLVFIMLTIDMILNSMENSDDSILVYFLMSTLELFSFIYSYYYAIDSKVINMCLNNIMIFLCDILLLYWYDRINIFFPLSNL